MKGLYNMNKYMGFYELKYIGLPSVPWKEFKYDTKLDDNILWTLRVAIEGSNDLNLPRYIGISSKDAYVYGKTLIEKYNGTGLIVYYPYFVAEKSGVMEISMNCTVIEAVKGDLWNFVTLGHKDVNIRITDNNKIVNGDTKFLSNNEIDEITKYCSKIKYEYKELMYEGKSIITEWSYAYKSDINKNKIGERYLVFYELRSL